MKQVLLRDSFCTKQKKEQRNSNKSIVKHKQSIGSDIFKCNPIQTSSNSKNGKIVLTDEKWYKNNDNSKSIKKQKKSKLGNKEDIFPKIKKKTTSATVHPICSTIHPRSAEKTGIAQYYELKNWIQSRLGKKICYKQQQHQRNTERILRERHIAANNTAIKLATNERKIAFKKFYSQIYDLDQFKTFYKSTVHNRNSKKLLLCKTFLPKESTNYYHPLITNYKHRRRNHRICPFTYIRNDTTN
jgi:hypothetical protein